LLNFDLGLERQHSENLRGASFMRHSYRLTVLKTWKEFLIRRRLLLISSA
jgi:hypothetical protein